MAKKRSLVIEILGNNKMGRAVRDAMGSLKRLGSFARGVGRGIGTAFKIGAAGVASMVGALTVASKFYAKQEQADMDLAAAIRNRGQAVDELLPKLKAEAAAIQQETKHGDEFVQTLQAQAINMGITADGATDATKAAMGLAKAYGLELVSAMRLVTRARVGDTSSLKRYGIMLDDTLSAEEKYQAILKIGRRNYSLVTDEVKTLAGRFAQFKNAIGDVAEAFGGAFVEGVDLKNLFKDMSERAVTVGKDLQTKLIPHFQKFREIVEGLMAGGGDRDKAIADIKATWLKAVDVVKPKMEEWGLVVGAAIWRGFKKGSVKAGGAAAQQMTNVMETPTGRTISMMLPQELRGAFGAAGAFAGTGGGFGARFRSANEAIIRSAFGLPGASAGNPIHVQEVKPIDGVGGR